MVAIPEVSTHSAPNAPLADAAWETTLPLVAAWVASHVGRRAALGIDRRDGYNGGALATWWLGGPDTTAAPGMGEGVETDGH